jgi:hypothetical protein
MTTAWGLSNREWRSGNRCLTNLRWADPKTVAATLTQRPTLTIDFTPPAAQPLTTVAAPAAPAPRIRPKRSVFAELSIAGD